MSQTAQHHSVLNLVSVFWHVSRRHCSPTPDHIRQTRDVDLMGTSLLLGQRRGRWTNIKPELGKWLVLTGLLCNITIATDRFVLRVTLSRLLGWPSQSHRGLILSNITCRPMWRWKSVSAVIIKYFRIFQIYMYFHNVCLVTSACYISWYLFTSKWRWLPGTCQRFNNKDGCDI